MALLPGGDGSSWTINNVRDVINQGTTMLLGIAGVVASIYIIIGAFQYLTAYGSEEKAESGKKTLTWAIIGLVVVILSSVIVNNVWRLFSGGNRPL
jgi:hypothetical protein